MRRRLSLPLLIALIAGAVAPLAAGRGVQATRETDLDRFMAAVLARRDNNWKKLQQYILDERERVQVTGPGGARLFGFVRDYRWFVKDGFFIRSPLAANGVTIGEEERRRAEAQWLRREQRRDARRTRREREQAEAEGRPAPIERVAAEDALDDVLRQQGEPRFVRAAYFLRFKFERGRYALAGRETVNGRELLKIEYYPARLFDDDDDHRTRTETRVEQAGRGGRRRDDAERGGERIERQMNKASLVTLWILRDERQIVRYVFDNIDWGFLPGRTVVRVDDLTASMTMAEAFPAVWLPRQVEAAVALETAAGRLAARYDILYADYKEAGVTVKVR